MPRQRERTTALPKPRPRPVAAAKGRFAWSEQHTRLSILGATALLLLVVLGVFAYRIYESNVLRPASTVLNVDGSKVSLGYFAARLGPFAIQNQQSSSDISVLSENLLTKLERELIVEKLARDMNLPLDDKRLTEFIATGFGVPVGPSGSSFDVLYRNQLRTLQISNSDYRRLRRAELADDELAKQIESNRSSARRESSSPSGSSSRTPRRRPRTCSDGYARARTSARSRRKSRWTWSPANRMASSRPSRWSSSRNRSGRPSPGSRRASFSAPSRCRRTGGSSRSK